METTTLPPFLYGSFRRYEADITTFVQWLLDTIANFDTARLPVTTDIRDNIIAWQAASAVIATTHKISPEYVGSLLRIVLCWGLEIPPVIYRTAERIVNGRKTIAALAVSEDASLQPEPKSSLHLVYELEDMCLLVRRELAGSPHEAQRSDSKDIEAQPTSRDAEADIKDSEQTANGKKKMGKKKKTKAKKKKPFIYTVQEADSPNDVAYSLPFFELGLFFGDLNKLRYFIKETVEAYLNDKIDLMSCSVVIDMALHVAKGLITEATATGSQQDFKPNLQQYMYAMVCSCRGLSLPITRESVISPLGMWCFLPTNSLLSDFWRLRANKGGSVPADLDLMQTYDASADADTMSASARFDEDKSILFSILAEYSLFDNGDQIMVVHDEISRAIFAFFESPLEVCSASFTCQVLLDVHHSLRHSHEKAFKEFKLYGLRLSRTIEEY